MEHPGIVEKWGWNWVILEIPPNPTHSVVLILILLIGQANLFSSSREMTHEAQTLLLQGIDFLIITEDVVLKKGNVKSP